MCNTVNLGFVYRDLNEIVIAMGNRNYGEAEKLLKTLVANTERYHLDFVDINYNNIAKYHSDMKTVLQDKFSKEYDKKLEDHCQKLQDCFDGKVEQEVRNRLKAMGGGQLRETSTETCR